MNGFTLYQNELETLHAAHRSAKKTDAKVAYKINAIILLGTGYTLRQVKNVLFLDDETLRSYVNLYKGKGVSGLFAKNHQGRACKLTESEQDILFEELENTIHLTTHSVIEFVDHKFNKSYSPSGMRDLLHRLGYEYKKPKL